MSLKPVSVLSSLLLVALLAACGKPPEPQPEVRPVRTLVISALPTKLMNTYAGDVRARYESVLGFRVGGKIAQRLVDVGADVKKGQELFRLDASDLQLQSSAADAQLNSAKAEFSMAQSDLDRYRDLSKKGYVSKSELDRAEMHFKSAQAAVNSVTAQKQQSDNQRGYSSLRADADGVVTAVLAEAGTVVAPGTPVVKVSQHGALEVATTVPEDQIGRVRVGMPVTVSVWVDGKTQVDGSVREVASVADPLTRTYPVRVTLPQAPPSMRLGMTASVSIPLATPPLIHVPSSAIVSRSQEVGVWVLNPVLKVRFQPLQIAGVEGNDLLVAAGLKPGDEVVTAGAPLLTEGQQVKRLAPVLAQPAAPAAG